MTTATSPCAGTTTPSAAKSAAAHDCCTALECFEKPRFFCGQLLTDVDLEATVSYVAAKNKLHNRYLFGTGVACGLAVRCDPCNSGSVIVESGYALDCSGNDIIVCSDYSFDVKGWLDRRKKEQQADCSGRTAHVPSDCDTDKTEYCLVLSYEEKPGKPVNALIRDNGCKANRCEPSRTLERFRIDLIDKTTAASLNVRPSVWSRISECMQKEGAKLTAYRNELAKVTTTQQLQPVYNRLRADILDFAQHSGLTHCDLIDKVCKIDAAFRLEVNPQPNTNTNPIAGTLRFDEHQNPILFSPSANQLIDLYSRLLTDCFCDALLVPCAPCCDDSDYVLLACLTINQGKVISICNTVRTQLITGPAVRYWAQPLFDGIGRMIESICCPTATAANTKNDVAGQYQQASAAARMAGAYSSSLLQRFQTSAPASTNAARSLDLFQQPLAEVQKRMADIGVQATVTHAATVEDAFRFANLRDFSLDIPAGARVEIIVAPDQTVAAIRVLGNNP